MLLPLPATCLDTINESAGRGGGGGVGVVVPTDNVITLFAPRVLSL